MNSIPRSLKLIASFMALVILITSCSSTTLIQSDPTGAKLYVDGEYVGRTPYPHADTKITGSPTQIRIEKEGYEDFHAVIIRSEEFDPVAIVTGIFFWVPLLWIMKYKPMRTYELKPVE